MAKAPAFDLWLEFEQVQPQPDDDPTDDFANMQVRLPDGRRYALNVWTFGFMRRARFPWPYSGGNGRAGRVPSAARPVRSLGDSRLFPPGARSFGDRRRDRGAAAPRWRIALPRVSDLWYDQLSPYAHAPSSGAWPGPLLMGIHDRDYYRKEGPSHLASWEGRACAWIIGVTIAVFVLQMATRTQAPGHGFVEPVTEALSLDVPKVMAGQAWRLLTSAFLHSTSDYLHIVFNLLFLWWFGRLVEERLGSREFVAFYLLAAVLSGAGFVLASLAGFHPYHSSAVGASGAVTAVLLLSAIYKPDQVILLFLVLPVPIWAFVAFIIARDSFSFLGKASDGVGTSAHLAGALVGFLYYRFGWHLTGWLHGWAAWARRKPSGRLRIYAPEDEAAVPAASRIPDEQLEAQMDAILAKVSQVGMLGLTESEKQVLLRASAAVRKKHP